MSKSGGRSKSTSKKAGRVASDPSALKRYVKSEAKLSPNNNMHTRNAKGLSHVPYYTTLWVIFNAPSWTQVHKRQPIKEL